MQRMTCCQVVMERISRISWHLCSTGFCGLWLIIGTPASRNTPLWVPMASK